MRLRVNCLDGESTMSLIRGYIHLHSRHSYDGKFTLAEIKQKCLELDLNFAVMTEHTDKMNEEDVNRASKDCTVSSDAEFVFIPGFELPYKNCHILLIGILNVDLNLTPIETIRAAKNRGAWIVLAHPHRNKFKVDAELMELLDGIEVWNQQYDGKYYPRFKSIKLFEKNIKKRQSLLAVAGLDMHRASHFGGPTVEMNAELTLESILENLKQGKYEIRSSGISLTSRPKLTGIKRLMVIFVGGFSCAAIFFAKKINKWMHEHNITVHWKLKEIIRRWL